MADFTETSTWVSTISGVDNGDAVNATETNNAPQQLTNRTRYLKDRVDGKRTATKADTAAGAETSSRLDEVGASGTSKYWLISESTVSGAGGRGRRYVDASRNGMIVETFNAAWDADTATWARDSGAQSSVKVELGVGLGGSEFDRGLVMYHATIGVTSGGWTDSAWDGFAILGISSSQLSSFLALFGNLTTGDTPAANTLYAQSFAKAHGLISVSSSTPNALDAFNVNVGSLALNGTTELLVPFRTPMADTNYTVCYGGSGNNGFNVHTITRATNQFGMRMFDASGSAVDLTAATARTFEFVVFGRQ